MGKSNWEWLGDRSSVQSFRSDRWDLGWIWMGNQVDFAGNLVGTQELVIQFTRWFVCLQTFGQKPHHLTYGKDGFLFIQVLQWSAYCLLHLFASSRWVSGLVSDGSVALSLMLLHWGRTWVVLGKIKGRTYSLKKKKKVRDYLIEACTALLYSVR